MFVQHVQGIRPGIATVNNDGQPGGVRQLHLLAKHPLLRLARRVIVKVVQPNLAPGDNFRMFGQLRKAF